MGGRRAVRALDPERIDVHVQDLKPGVLGRLLGAYQGPAPPRPDRFVRGDQAESGVAVAHVAKTDHQQPLLRGGPGFVEVAARIPGRPGKDALL